MPVEDLGGGFAAGLRFPSSLQPAGGSWSQRSQDFREKANP